MSKEFIRKSKEDKPVIAICYDFDKTLSPDDMQAQGYIQSVGEEVESFWKESNEQRNGPEPCLHVYHDSKSAWETRIQ